MNEELPALVLLDLVMPGLGGADVLDQMRADPRLRKVPVIILSNKVISLEDVKRLEKHYQVVFQSKGIWSETETVSALHRALFGMDVLPPHTSALVKQAVVYLQENYTRLLSRWEIADAVGVSEDYLSRVFNRELGLTPWDYLNRYRILRAKTFASEHDREYWTNFPSGRIRIRLISVVFFVERPGIRHRLSAIFREMHMSMSYL